MMTSEHAGESALSVGDLRTALVGLDDNTRIAVEGWKGGWLVSAWTQASDAYPEPWGTDPIKESTVSVLVLEVGDPSGGEAR